MSSKTSSKCNGRAKARKAERRADDGKKSRKAGLHLSGSLGDDKMQRDGWSTEMDDDQWTSWIAHLGQRKTLVDAPSWGPRHGIHPLKWALAEDTPISDGPSLLKSLTISAAKRKRAAVDTLTVRRWLDLRPTGLPTRGWALECLGWAHALPAIARGVDPKAGCELLETLEHTVDRAGQLSAVDEPVVQQLLAGELAWTLAVQFPEFPTFSGMKSAGVRCISEGMTELLDGQGLTNSRYTDDFRLLLACWTRCLQLASNSESGQIAPAAREQYDWMVRQALRLCRPDGSLLLSSDIRGDWRHDLFRACLKISGDSADQTIAGRILPSGQPPSSPVRRKRLPEPSVYSEWSEVVVMRSKWSRKSPVFSGRFHGSTIRSELITGGQVVWSGPTLPTVTINAQPCNVSSEWRELCWFTDTDVDYLELEADLIDGWKIQRQWMLARKDQWFYMADAVLGPQDADIEYSLGLPLETGVQYAPLPSTREGYLVGSKPLATVLPLALNEWQTSAAPGAMECDGRHLVLSQRASAARLYSPWFVDLRPRRMQWKRTWRQLTVAEKLETVTPDVAAGYRVQIGRRQWLFYRSLARPANRSVLGQNLSQEFVAARFDMQGEIDEIIEIE